MNNLFIKTEILLDAVLAPSTGSWVNTAKARNILFTAYGSGVGSNIILQYTSPFFASQGVTFYTFSGLTTGYANPALLNSPMTQIRAIASGTGTCWAAATLQN